MQGSWSPWFVTLCATLPLLVSSTALADTGADACNLVTSGNCMFVTTPATCTGQCTPPSCVAECDGECNASASATCTGACNASCMTQCTASPGTFSCAAACTSDCQASCTVACSGKPAGCVADCMLDCPNRCALQCNATPPMADCAAKCQVSCNGSCQVQANIDCHENCTLNVAPGACNVDCMAPSGAVFCNGQYVNVGKAVNDCLTYLKSQGITVTTTCTVGKGCTTSGGCSATPALGAGRVGWGTFGLAGLLLGVGLARSRRKRRA